MASSTIEITGFDQARALFGDLVTERAITSAVNKVATQTRTQISKAVRENYNARVAAVNKAVKVTRARIGGKEAFVIGAGARIPFKGFSPKWLGRGGVSILIKKSSGRQRIKQAFSIPGANGHVFVRTAGAPKRIMTRGRYAGTGIKRQPIHIMRSIAIPQMIKNPQVLERILANAQAIAPRIFQHEVEFYASRYLPR